MKKEIEKLNKIAAKCFGYKADKEKEIASLRKSIETEQAKLPDAADRIAQAMNSGIATEYHKAKQDKLLIEDTIEMLTIKLNRLEKSILTPQEATDITEKVVAILTEADDSVEAEASAMLKKISEMADELEELIDNGNEILKTVSVFSQTGNGTASITQYSRSGNKNPVISLIPDIATDPVCSRLLK